jgi:hypothetical protein
VPIPASLMVARVQQAFDAVGNPVDPKFTATAKKFFDELMWFTEALAAKRACAAKTT